MSWENTYEPPPSRCHPVDAQRMMMKWGTILRDPKFHMYAPEADFPMIVCLHHEVYSDKTYYNVETANRLSPYDYQEDTP